MILVDHSADKTDFNSNEFTKKPINSYTLNKLENESKKIEFDNDLKSSKKSNEFLSVTHSEKLGYSFSNMKNDFALTFNGDYEFNF